MPVFDMIVKSGLIVDGTGAAAGRGDIAVQDGRIAAVGVVEGTAREVIDAEGCVVTPGFVDVHTHYDGQALWSEFMTPSSSHGVTTVLTGNCGVGFAPCRPQDRDLLISTMEEIEDIPAVVMAHGLEWNWETFPEYLSALSATKRDINVATLVPHSPLRIYAVGDRDTNRRPADAADLARMAGLVDEACEGGAFGLGTIFLNRRSDGEDVATFGASEAELIALTRALGPGRFLQVAIGVESDDDACAEQYRMLGRVSEAAQAPVTFSLAQINERPDQWRMILDVVAELNEDPEVRIHPQIFPRPFGMIAGFNLSANPFSLCPSYQMIAHLPFEQRIAELRKADVRNAILNEQAGDSKDPLVALARAFEYTYPLGDPVNYEPDPSTSIAAIARARKITPQEVAYDAMLADDGTGMLYVAVANYGDGSLDFVLEMLSFPGSIVGLGDGGAHYGMICDASYPTFMLTHWVRDRAGTRIPIEQAVRSLAYDPAQLLDLDDRGALLAGRRADLNVIDLTNLRLHPPTVQFDLPGGGRRLDQKASGYKLTLVAGKAITRDDQPTGELPGQLTRKP